MTPEVVIALETEAVAIWAPAVAESLSRVLGRPIAPDSIRSNTLEGFRDGRWVSQDYADEYLVCVWRDCPDRNPSNPRFLYLRLLGATREDIAIIDRGWPPCRGCCDDDGYAPEFAYACARSGALEKRWPVEAQGNRDGIPFVWVPQDCFEKVDGSIYFDLTLHTGSDATRAIENAIDLSQFDSVGPDE